MEINFTKEEYRTLINALYLANWLISAYDTEDKPETKRYTKLEQKILSLAKDFGQEKLVEYDDKLKMYFHTKKVEDNLIENFISPYDNNTFWEELIDRLAKRDLFKDYEEKAIENMTGEEIFNLLSNYEEKYSLELEKNGIENLKIME